ncbi:hypothetical protein CVT24_001713 [Panaeolus cyanescens]|uniref:DNA breaking-rejoining enzyme n=1 Tax=Panaeolus cyanescens TaxID=181874 RepID=A0A409YYS6_9AGAR|nr:hypothetical protein CVT24_001713 [Panaeolus cyanescens]
MVQTQAQGNPRTHASPAHVEALKLLSLRERLLRNKVIDANNARRASEHLDFLNGIRPDDASDFESDITVSPEEMDSLLLPGADKDYADVVADRVKKWILEQKALQAAGTGLPAPPGKRVLGDADDDSSPNKKLKLFARAPLVDYDPTENPKLTFPQIWFVTEAAGKIPLPWFRPSSIEKLNINSMQASWTSACFFTTPDGTQKKFTVFDIDKILGMKDFSDLFCKETDIPFADWLIAARYRYDFEVARADWEAKHNGEAPDYSHADDLGAHFDFFENQKDAQVTYDFWKEEEARIRQGKVHGFKTNKDQLRGVFAMAKFKHEESIKKRSEDDALLVRIAGLEKLVQQGSSSVRSGSSSQPVQGQGKQSFRASSGSSQSTPACLYCGETGHRVHDHPKDKTKFSDGKAFWATYDAPSRRLLTPDGKEICIPFCIKGKATFLPTTPSRSHVEPDEQFARFLEASLPPSLLYSDFSSSIIRRPPGPSSSSYPLSLFDKIVTPYSADSFELALSSLNIAHKYPLLCHNLRHGFPLGTMPDIPSTRIFANHFSTLGHEKLVDDYLKDEVDCGRMDGPFSQSQVELILRGPFHSSPLLIVSQPQGPNLPDKIRVCRHLSKGDPRKDIPSVNSFITKDDFPTRFDTAAKVANMVVNSVAPLGVPWHPTKGTLAFTSRPTFLGLLWDIPSRSVALPEEKCLKFLFRASLFVSRFASYPCNLKDVERIHGSLCYISFVFPDGRSRLPSLSNFAASFNCSEFSSRYPPHSVISDLRWWIGRLSVPGHSRPLVPPGPLLDFDIFVDASTEWGIGISIRGRWMAFPLIPDWKSLAHNRDICWLECLAVEFLVYVLEAEGLENCSVVVRSDNMGTIGAVQKGRSRNPHINLSMRRIFSVIASRFISLNLVYVASEDNVADPISRGIFDSQDDAQNVESSLSSNTPLFLSRSSDNSVSRPPPVHSSYSRFNRASPYTRAGTLSRTGSSVALHPPSNVAPHITLPNVSTAGSVASVASPSYLSPYVRNRARPQPTVPTLTQSVQNPPPSRHSSLRPISSYQPSFVRSINNFVTPSPSARGSPNPAPLQPADRDVSFGFELRPKVTAKERLEKWTTPYGIQRRQEASLGFLPKHAVDKVYSLVLDSLEDSSKTSYGAGLLRFTQFCDEHDVDEEKRMPASPELVAAFVASAAGSVSGSTIKTWLSGLRAWHIFNRAPWNEDEFLSLIRTAAKKIGVTNKRPQRNPVSLKHLSVLVSSLDIGSPSGAAIWACATTTFFGCRRLGETTVTSPPFDCLRNVARGGDISVRYAKDATVPESICIHLPWTKTTKDEGGKIILTRRGDDLCPVFAFLNHFHTNSFPNTPKEDLKNYSLFAFLQEDGSICEMYKDFFLATVQSIWKTHLDLDNVSGHSFRIGGAVALLMAGVEPEVVAASGGWTSMAFLLYWRKLEHIIPQFTAKAYAGTSGVGLSAIHAKLERMRVDNNLKVSTIDEAAKF